MVPGFAPAPNRAMEHISNQLLNFKYFLYFGAFLALLLGGWNAWFQLKLKTYDSKIESIQKLWTWKDGFVELYSSNRLWDSREYASKIEIKELKNMISQLDSKLDKILFSRRSKRA